MILNKTKTTGLALLFSMIGVDVFAQDVVDAVCVDSIAVDSLALVKEFELTCESDEEKARMDSCIQARYVIVAENGMYGIYDNERKDSVTPIDMDYIQYSHCFHPEEDMYFCYFYFEKGLKIGKIGINMNDNTKTSVFCDNPRLVASLDECDTIDSLVTVKCRDVLRECMMDINGTQGQIAVVDAQTSQLLSWEALEGVENKIVNAPLLKRICNSETFLPLVSAGCLAWSNTSMEDSIDTGNGILEVNDSLIIRDHNWRKGGYGMMTYRQALLNRSRIGMYYAIMTMKDGMEYWNYATDTTKNTNAMELAALFNNIYHADTINVDASKRRNIREIATGMFKEGGIQHRHAPKTVELAGMYNVSDNGKEQTFSFVGCFPADKPRFAVSMVVVRKHRLPASTTILSGAINDLIKWLNKR